MSTPTTAVATLPPYRTHHYHPSYSHHHHQPASSTGYRSSAAAAPVLNPPTTTTTSASSPSTASHLLPLYQPVANAGYPTDGVTPSAAPRPPPHGRIHREHDPSDAQYQDDRPSSTMASSANAAAALSDVEQPSRKRRRSREPDWDNFYRNGLPREVIVIDDSPEPEANTSRKILNGHAAANAAAAATNESTTRHAVKKRRRNDGSSTGQPNGYHVQYVDSQTDTPKQNSTPNGSTISSTDRTNSALHTTAPTSLSSNGTYEDVQLPLKRKRTRQQLANEAKRREIDGLGDTFSAYEPPPFPPKKAGDVHVRVIHDVRLDMPFIY